MWVVFLLVIDGLSKLVDMGRRFFVFLLRRCWVGLIWIFVGGVFLWLSRVRNVFELVFLYFKRIFLVFFIVFFVLLLDWLWWGLLVWWLKFYLFENFRKLLEENCGLLLVISCFGMLCFVKCVLSFLIIDIDVVFLRWLSLKKLLK